MQKTTHQPVIKILVWLTLEIVLTLLNLDHLADYSEFLYGHPTTQINQTITVIRY